VLGTAVYHLFNAHPVVHIDWRWEFLSKALDALLPLYEHMLRYWDEFKMLAGETSTLTSEVVKQVSRALAIPRFLPLAEMLRVAGKSIEHYAHKLEGCICHPHIWIQTISHKRKVSKLHEETGFKHCCWKGRMGPWFIMIGLSELLRHIATCSSELLDKLISDLGAHAATLLSTQSKLRARIIEELNAKFAFLASNTL